MKLTSEQIAFGRAAWDHYHGTNAFEIIERADGYFAVSSGPSEYLAEPALWPPHVKAALERHALGRGLENAEVLSIDELSARHGTFDTILMLGNNVGLFGNSAKAKRLLRRFKSLTRPGAALIAESLNVYLTQDPDHLAYLAANRERGRMSGQIRARSRAGLRPR